MRKLALTAALVTFALAASPASATIILVNASSIQGENVLFNQGVTTGTTVGGFTNDTNTSVAFMASGDVLSARGGQARIEGATAGLDNLMLSLTGGATFNDLEFNLFGGTATSVSFSLVDNMGEVFNFTQALTNGENFFGFQGIDGQTIASASFTAIGGTIGDVRQIRLNPAVAVSAVPEPATWAMMLLGFGGIGASMRRRRAIKAIPQMA